MNKNFLKFFTFIGLFIFSISNIFAFNANLQLDKSETDINDYINLRVIIDSNEGGAIGITEIKGLENFELINQSQSQSSSSKSVIINGKTQSETKITINLDLTLKAKSKGEFEIGPAILESDSGKIETNSVQIKVSGDNLFINNNHLTVHKKTINTQNNKVLNNNVSKNKKIETYENIDKKEFHDNNTIYLLLGILMITGLGFYFILKNNPELLEKIQNNLNKKNKNKKFNIKQSIENKKNIINLNDKNNLKEIDFEEKVQEIIYPELSDKDFINKISDILKQKLENKYNIKNIYNKSFDEIALEIDNKDILGLIELINKAKYSNIILNNNEILDLVKNI